MDELQGLIQRRSALAAALESAKTDGPTYVKEAGSEMPGTTEDAEGIKAQIAEIDRAIAELGSGRNA